MPRKLERAELWAESAEPPEPPGLGQAVPRPVEWAAPAAALPVEREVPRGLRAPLEAQQPVVTAEERPGERAAMLLLEPEAKEPIWTPATLATRTSTLRPTGPRVVLLSAQRVRVRARAALAAGS